MEPGPGLELIGVGLMATRKKRRLGRGLGSMISEPVHVELPAESTASQAATIDRPPPSEGDGISQLLLSEVSPNPFQPRKTFEDGALKSLADSIRTAGVMQPVVVRPSGSGYELVAGERRWRAAELAGLERLPALVREIDDRTAAEWSIIENVQREDLNPMERAEAFLRLQDQFGLTHQEIAEQVGLNRSSVTNHLRLNELDKATKEAVRSSVLTMGHAKALLAITNMKERARFIRSSIAGNWSVRDLERRVRRFLEGGSTPAEEKIDPRKSNLADLERKLGEHLGTRVQIQQQGRKAGKGKLVIEFFDLDQFDGLLKQMGFASH